MAAPVPAPINEYPNPQVAVLHDQAVAAAAQAAAGTGLPNYQTAAQPTQSVGAPPDIAQDFERRLAEARGAWEAESQGRVAAAVQEAVQRTEANARAQLEQTTEVRLAMELERRLAEARTSWETELQGRVAAAVQEAEQKVRLEAGAQQDQTNDVRLAQEVERRLAEARATWETEFQGRVAASVDQAVQQTRSEVGAQQNQENEVRLAHEVERRMAEARASWEAEFQSRVAAAVQDAVQKTAADVRAQLSQANEAQLAEVLQRRLGEARTAWEPELQGRVAAAVQESVQRSEASFQGRLEQAQHQWREASARELAELSARCTQAEAALTAFRNQPPQGQVNDEALRTMSAELASAQALVRARETELGESRHSLERARSEISSYAQDAESTVERNRTAWSAEREILLAQAEESAQQRVKQALERWQYEAEAALTKAQQEWAAGEATRFAVAESEWRENIGIAKSRAPITKLTKKRGRIHVSGRFKLFVVVAAALVAMVTLYPRVEPVIDRMWPKIIEYKGEIEPTVRDTTKEVKSWLSDAVKKSKEAVKRKKNPSK